jgi:hypothetical protein
LRFKRFKTPQFLDFEYVIFLSNFCPVLRLSHVLVLFSLNTSEKNSFGSIEFQNYLTQNGSMKRQKFKAKFLSKALKLLAMGLIPFAANAQTVMFDDFNYSGVNDAQLGAFNKWTIVDGVNGPPSNAMYSKNNITFINDPADASNKLMTLSTTVNGSTRATTHSRIETVGYEYFEGTYAARVYFSETPFQYKDANIQTFYTIVSYLLGGDGSRYSELDFEYMAADKWGTATDKQVMYMTSWNRYIAEPWQAWKNHFAQQKSFVGWHTCIVSCTNKVDVKFWLDGVYIGSMAQTDNDGSSVYPRSPMQVAFANWIWNNVIGSSTANRTTTMQVDWTLFGKDLELSPTEVNNRIAAFRAQGVQRRNLLGQEYRVTPANQAPTVSLTSPVSGTSLVAPASVTLSANASDVDGTIARVEFYNGTTLLASDNAAPYSYSWTAVPAGNYSITAKAFDNLGASATSTASLFSVTTPVSQNPYTGTPISLPGTIEAENFDTGGQGLAFNELTSTNQGGQYRNEAVDLEASTNGGYNVGWIQAGEWLEYTVNVTAAGTYSLQASVAAISAGNTFRAELDGVVLGTFSVPNTGGWQNWQTVSLSNISLGTGIKVLRLVFVSGNHNIDKLTVGAAVNQAPSVSLTSPLNNSNVVLPANVSLSANASDADGSIALVEFFQGNTLIGSDNTAPFAFAWTIPAAGSYEFSARATDNAGATTTSATSTIVATQATFTLLLEAENYSMMAGVQKESTTDIGGGQNVGYVDLGDWMSYYTINFPSSGQYKVEYRVASVSGSVLSLDLNAGAIQLGSVIIPATGGWQTWTTVSHTVNVNAGTYNLGIYAQGGGWNLNWIRITRVSGARDTYVTNTIPSDYSTAQGLQVCPNPAMQELFIQGLEGMENGSVRIVNQQGVEVYSGSFFHRLDVSFLSAGIYVLECRSSDQQIFSKRFVKM